MATIILGKVRPVYVGNWQAEKADYEYYDMVKHEGMVYLAIADNIAAAHTPPDHEDEWILFGSQGVKGDPGIQGPDGDVYVPSLKGTTVTFTKTDYESAVESVPIDLSEAIFGDEVDFVQEFQNALTGVGG